MKVEQTDYSQREGGVGECGKRLDKDLICLCAVPIDTDNRVLRAWGGVGAGWWGTMGGKRDIRNLNNKD